MSTQSPIRPSFDVGAAIQIAQQLGLLDILKAAITDAIGGLLRHRAPEPKPVPNVGVVDRLPDDDHIAAPPIVVANARKVASVRLRIQKAQYSRERHPDAYTEDNPLGLYQGDLARFEHGAEAINFESKVWLDLTAFDQDGKEFLGGDLVAAGLSFRGEHVITDEAGRVTRITGKGQRPDGSPEPWEQVEETSVGLGEKSWINSLGCNEQVKVWREGTFRVVGSIGGVKSNDLTIRVS